MPPSSREHANKRPEVRAEGCERHEQLTAVMAGGPLCWTERRLVIRSHQLAQAQVAVVALNARGRGKPRFTELPKLQAAVETILPREQVQGLLQGR